MNPNHRQTYTIVVENRVGIVTEDITEKQFSSTARERSPPKKPEAASRGDDVSRSRDTSSSSRDVGRRSYVLYALRTSSGARGTKASTRLIYDVLSFQLVAALFKLTRRHL